MTEQQIQIYHSQRPDLVLYFSLVMIKRPSIAKNTSLLVLAQIIRVAAQALFFIGVRRYLSTASRFGDFWVAFVLAKLLTQFVELGFSTTLLRDASKDRQELRAILSSALGLRTVTSVGILLILLIFAFFLPYPQTVGYATLLFGLSYLAQSFSQLFFAALRSHERVYFEPVALLIYAALLLGGTWFVISSDLGLIAIAFIVLGAQTGCLLFIFLALKIALPQEIGFSLNLERIKKFWYSCWPIGVGTIGYLIYYQADTVLLYFLRGQYETGVYGTAYQLVAISLILPTSFFTALLPRLVQALHSNPLHAKRLLETSSRFMLSLGLPLATGTVLIAPRLLPLLFPQEAADSILPLQLLIWLAAFSYWGQTFTNAAIVIRGARIYMRLSLIGGLVNTVANLLVIPYYGYLGACFTTLGTELLINGLFWSAVCRSIGPVKIVSPLWRPGVASLIMMVGLFSTSFLPLLIQIFLAMILYGLALLMLGGFHSISLSLFETPTSSPEE